MEFWFWFLRLTTCGFESARTSVVWALLLDSLEMDATLGWADLEVEVAEEVHAHEPSMSL